jgi:hypothetical protein
MTFEEANAKASELWDASTQATLALDAISGGGAMGLTPDAVKETAEWRELRAESAAAFQRLRTFNAWYVRTFKRELAAERAARYGRVA